MLLLRDHGAVVHAGIHIGVFAAVGGARGGGDIAVRRVKRTAGGRDRCVC